MSIEKAIDRICVLGPNECCLFKFWEIFKNVGKFSELFIKFSKILWNFKKYWVVCRKGLKIQGNFHENLENLENFDNNSGNFPKHLRNFAKHLGNFHKMLRNVFEKLPF